MGEWVRLVADYGPWSLPVLLACVGVRSGPARTAAFLLSAEMRRRYEDFLRRRGVPEADIRRLLKQDDEPPAAPQA